MTSYPATPAYGEGEAAYAGFWIRFGALIIDFILLSIVGFITGFVIGLATGGAGGEAEFAQGLSAFTGFVVGVAYFVIMESSERQATLGKLAVGIKVTDMTDMEGARISAGVAAIRYFSKILSGIILLIGYIMAAFTPKKQALHDIIAKTLVVKQ